MISINRQMAKNTAKNMALVLRSMREVVARDFWPEAID